MLAMLSIRYEAIHSKIIALHTTLTIHECTQISILVDVTKGASGTTNIIIFSRKAVNLYASAPNTREKILLGPETRERD